MVNTWKIVLAALAIFAAGVFTGGVTMSINMRALRPRGWPQRPAVVWNPATNALAVGSTNGISGTNGVPKLYQPLRGPGGPRIAMIRNVVQGLDIQPSQRDRIEFLTRESEQVIRETWEPVNGKIQRELRTLESRILDAMEPSQRSVFRELLKKRPSEFRSGSTNALSAERTNN